MRFHPAFNTRSMRALTFGLTLVRHGETQYNKQGLLQGQTIDAPLSDVGLQQAEAAGRYLKDVRVTNVFVSDMMRAQQTAEAIVKNNSSCLGLQMVTDPLLKEKSFGVAEGRPVKEMREMAKAAGVPFPDFTPPEGETPQQVRERVKKFLDKMLLQIGTEHSDDHGREETPAPGPPSPPEGRPDDGLAGVPVHALVVTHGSYMTVAARYFVEELHCGLPQDCDEARMFSLSPNTGLCRFTMTVRKEGDDRFVLSGMNCVFMHRKEHLNE